MITPATAEERKARRQPKKSSFSLAIAEKIFEMISRGNYVETAAAHAGINKSTYYEWIKRGRREITRLNSSPRAKPNSVEADFVFFYRKVEHCLAEAEARALGRISKAAEGGFVLVEVKEVKDASNRVTETVITKKTMGPQWQAEAWRLERMFPKKFGRKVEVTQQEKGETQANLTPDEFVSKCQELSVRMLSFDPREAEAS